MDRSRRTEAGRMDVSAYGTTTGSADWRSAAFDYLAGYIKRAPRWMQRMSLEWLYRLLQGSEAFMETVFYIQCEIHMSYTNG